MTSHKDDLRSRVLSKEGEANWDKIFPPKPKKERWVPPPLPEEVTHEDISNSRCTGQTRK